MLHFTEWGSSIEHPMDVALCCQKSNRELDEHQVKCNWGRGDNQFQFCGVKLITNMCLQSYSGLVKTGLLFMLKVRNKDKLRNKGVFSVISVVLRLLVRPIPKMAWIG